MTPPLELYPYQQSRVERFWRSSCAIGDDCGMGKTLVAIAIKQHRWAFGYRGPWLVLCRKSAKAQWVAFLRQQDPYTPIIVTGKSGEWPRDEPSMQALFHPRRNCWVIAHHEALSLPKPNTNAWRSRTFKAPVVWRDYMWEGIVLDEAHRFKDRRASRTQWLKGLQSDYNIALSGSMMESEPADLWSVLNWLDPKQFSSYWTFFDEFVVWEHPYGAPPQARVAKGVKNLDVLARLLKPMFIRQTKADVRADLPPKTVSYIPVEMDPKQAQVYKELKSSKDIEVLLSYRDDDPMLIPNVLAQRTRMQQIASDPALLNVDAPSAKIEWLREYLEDNPHENVVVFSRFRDVAIRVANEFDAGLCIGGVLDPAGAFVRGDKRILAGTIQSMGSSLNLGRASTAVFIDQLPSSIEMTQAEERIYRIDATEPKHIIYLYHEKTVDVSTRKARDEKWSIMDLVYATLAEWRDK